MPPAAPAWRLLESEARGLLTRLVRVQPFALTETMVPAATVSMAAQAAVEDFLLRGRRAMRAQVLAFLRWLRSPEGVAASPAEAHRRFALLRIRFNIVLSEFDVFSEVMTQRSENENGVLLSGLDILADDALRLPLALYEPPPVVCYLQRGQGAAIRRARTRLPGGRENPVAIIHVPRERMVGSGIASSLVHECGHQGSALLDLLPGLHRMLQARARSDAAGRRAWLCWDRWIGEIVSDLWSAARVGIGAPLGLMGVVALPRIFVFRRSVDEAHPIPWIRVKLSCAMGRGLYPHPQWDELARLWHSFYPPDDLEPEYRTLLAELERTIPAFVHVLLQYRAPRLRGRTLGQVLVSADRAPAALRGLLGRWQREPELLQSLSPTLAFALAAQGRMDGVISPELESRLLTKLLTHWALKSAVDAAATCVSATRRRVLVPAS
jgi:hypothetical protein